MAGSAIIRQLWRYPVKSLRGEQLQQVSVTSAITADREFGVFDAVSGKLLSAKSVPGLLHLRARHRAGETEILHDHSWLAATAPEAVAALSAAAGRPVQVRRAIADVVSAIDMEVDDGDVRAEALTTFETQPGSLFDSRSPLHLVSAATLQSLEADYAAGAGAVERYRPNLVVDGITALAEDAWVGRTVKLGSVIATVRCKTERCVLPSRAQRDEVALDRGLLRFLKNQREFCVGIYLQIEQAGEICVGDPIVVT